MTIVPTFVGAVVGAAAVMAGAFLSRRTLQRTLNHAVVDRVDHVLDERLDRIEHMLTNPDQAWYWTPEWQAGELEADDDLRMGRGTTYDSSEAFLSGLDAIPAEQPAETSARGAA